MLKTKSPINNINQTFTLNNFIDLNLLTQKELSTIEPLLTKYNTQVIESVYKCIKDLLGKNIADKCNHHLTLKDILRLVNGQASCATNINTFKEHLPILIADPYHLKIDEIVILGCKSGALSYFISYESFATYYFQKGYSHDQLFQILRHGASKLKNLDILHNDLSKLGFTHQEIAQIAAHTSDLRYPNMGPELIAMSKELSDKGYAHYNLSLVSFALRHAKLSPNRDLNGRLDDFITTFDNASILTGLQKNHFFKSESLAKNESSNTSLPSNEDLSPLSI